MASSSATPKRWGSSTWARRIWAEGSTGPSSPRRGAVARARCASKRPTKSPQVLLEEVVPQVHHEVVVAQELPGYQDGVGQAQGRLLLEVGDLQAPFRPVPDRPLDLRRGVPDDDAHLLDPGAGDRLQTVEEHRFVGHRHQLLGAGVSDGPQPRPRASRKDQGLHYQEGYDMRTGQATSSPALAPA